MSRVILSLLARFLREFIRNSSLVACIECCIECHTNMKGRDYLSWKQFKSRVSGGKDQNERNALRCGHRRFRIRRVGNGVSARGGGPPGLSPREREGVRAECVPARPLRSGQELLGPQ